MGFFWGNIGGNVYSGLSHKIEALKFRSVVILRFEKCETKRHTHTPLCVTFSLRTPSRRLRRILVSFWMYKKLSYRRETARCFLSLNVYLCHSRSLKVIETDTTGKLGYSFLFAFHSNWLYPVSFRHKAGYLSKYPLHSTLPLGLLPYRWFTCPQTVTHLGTNRVWRRTTTLTEANALPLNQTEMFNTETRHQEQ